MHACTQACTHTHTHTCTHEICSRSCGPMARYWCMRYEAKHHYFKDLAQKLKCFKNICKSLAYRHQYMLCYQMVTTKSLVKEMKIGRGELKTVKVHVCQLINSLIQNILFTPLFVVVAVTSDELPYYDVLLESQKLSSTCSVINR